MDFASLWAITPVALREFEAAARADGERVLENILLRRNAMEKQAARVRAAVREQSAGRLEVIPVYGILPYRPDWFAFTSLMEIRVNFDAALAARSTQAIIFDISSPGGTFAGVQELSDMIFEARGTKPIFSIANPLAASAALWLGSAADQFVITPSGEAGSIGVYVTHTDQSGLNKKLGIETTYISAGKYKVEQSPDGPLSSEAREHLQQSVNDANRTFLRQVSRNRGVKPSTVMADFGQGRVLNASHAVSARMVDEVMTLQELVSVAGNAAGLRDSRRAMTDAQRRERWAAMKRKVAK